MPQFEIVTIPCRSDNYAFLLTSAGSGSAVLVDAPEAGPIKTELSARGLTLSDILLTHHHDDHVAAVADLAGPDTRVVGARADAGRLPPLTLEVADGDTFTVLGTQVHVMDASGHTIGHVAFHIPEANAVFTGDSLMALGCGRLFEGDAATMWSTLTRLAALPPETLVCSGHEYTRANGRFAATVDPNNADLRARLARIDETLAAGGYTVPSLLSEELATNPFLRARASAVKTHLGMEGAEDVDVFAEVRRRKDSF